MPDALLNPDIAAAQAVVQALLAALGPDIVTTGALDSHRLADWSGVPAGEALALVRPRETTQVVTTLAICNSLGVAVVVQGGLTGLAGAASARDGEVVMSLERMRAIEEVDAVSATMTVQAGAVLETVQDAAAAAGAYFPLDLGARGSCTIGGAMATNAGGNRVIKYGMMRDNVLGIEAVLSNGRIVGGLHKMIKNNTGYDLKNLLIGSEGTLAVITRAVLRMRPQPAGVSTAWCGLRDFDAVTTLLRQAQAELAGGVSAFEVMWPGYYRFVLSSFTQLRAPLEGQHGFHVLLETDGANPEAQALQFEAFLGRMLEAGTIEDATLAMSGADAQRFWAIRDAPGEFPKLMPYMIGFDIGFAVRDVAEAANRIESGLAAQYPGMRALLYGHLGDGNIHLIADLPTGDAQIAADVQALVYEIVSDLKGSVSAEHGIGMTKKAVLGRTRTADEIATMADIKAALDPNAILGRGRVFG
jgi:FAD/FMN-containing dehydrogenase